MDIALTGSARERGAQILRAAQESPVGSTLYLGDEEYKALVIYLESHPKLAHQVQYKDNNRRAEYNIAGCEVFRVRKANHFRIYKT